MDKKTVVLIDNNSDDLDILEGAIKESDPSLMCISFVYADEAIRIIRHELKRLPNFIFIDVNTRRKTGTDCLVELRKIEDFNSCQIIMFSGMMPETVGDAFKTMGANHAFQKPASRFEYKEIIGKILSS